MSVHPAVGEFHPASDQLLVSTLAASAYSFLQPTSALHTATLVLAKRYLDPLALSATQAQAERLHASRRERKRGRDQEDASKRPFRMRQVHLEGLRTQQVWEQARRVLHASAEESEAHLRSLVPPQSGRKLLLRADSRDENEPRRKRAKFSRVKSGGSDLMPDGSEGEATSEDLNGSTELEKGPEEVAVSGVNQESEEHTDGADGGDDDVMMGSGTSSDIDDVPTDVFLPDKHGLNDGFFSIDDFNKQSDFLENQDARGEPENEASDEEEIDWGAEPLPLQHDGTLEEKDHSDDIDDDDNDESGPTFGNADLDGVDAESDASEANMPEDSVDPSANTNDILYADFFAPPPRKATKSTRMRALPKTQPTPSVAPQQEDDIDRTIAAVRRDIFEDELSAEEGSGAGSDAVPGDPRSRRSNHEKRQAKLAEEIRRLEAANVAKRDWTLSGEARAADRPLNSLLEEDLEFERAGKPVPVITNEVSEDIEALIKRRIINREFDEVIRRRPGDLITGAPAARRGRFELDDTKPQQSLAEVYEAEHLKKVDPDGYVDKRDEKLKKEHAAIQSLWAEISTKLDSLSNWHYKPKPPQANITIVADVPKVSLEDARPTAVEGMGAEESMLAPQEVYRPGEERSRADKQKEVVLKSGVPVAREEMSREEKLRRRRREKERIKKRGEMVIPKAATGGVKRAAERKGVVDSLKRGGVKVIGKRGELVNVEGKGIKGGKGAVQGSGSFKL
ncbi:MAG: hypothetical protein LQ343_006625 [Gyalolechia ehrenbergii]|nr:MAG: hypothetical protein LQ343_006625 [Gyalolechia ehrenbergii]